MLCPFCNLTFKENEIKAHIGLKHLGISTQNVENLGILTAEKTIEDQDPKFTLQNHHKMVPLRAKP